MKPDKLVEKVAQLLYRNFSETDADWENLPRMTQQVFAVVAEDAVRIALEEAAKVASCYSVESGFTTNEHMMAHRIATAIRALIPGERHD